MRLPRGIVRAFGLLLQLGAGVTFMLGLSLWTPASEAAAIPLLNSAYVGALLVAIAGGFSAWLLERHRDRISAAERAIATSAFAWGMLWWLWSGWREIDRFVPYEVRIPVLVVFLAATAVVMVALAARLRWTVARVPALLLLPGLLAIAFVAIGRASMASEHLFAHGGYLGWVAAVAAVIGLLKGFDRQGEAVDIHATASIELLHALLLWLVLLLVAHELSWVGSRIVPGHGVWSAVPWGLVPALGLGLVCEFAPGSGWPLGAHRRGYLVLGAVPVAVLLAAWSIAASVHASGDPSPLPFVDRKSVV
jgi:hypothetical protein